MFELRHPLRYGRRLFREFIVDFEQTLLTIRYYPLRMSGIGIEIDGKSRRIFMLGINGREGRAANWLKAFDRSCKH